MNRLDETVLEALRQSDSAWAMVVESKRLLYVTAAGVAANFLLALVAIGVPWWQRHSALLDAKKSEQKAWQRFIESFAALADAQDALVSASEIERGKSAAAFKVVELQLKGTAQALSQYSAAQLPVAAVLAATSAQQKAFAMLSHFPDLSLYGLNLMTFASVKKQMVQARDETRALLERTRTLNPGR